jgi:hypothetical protein
VEIKCERKDQHGFEKRSAKIKHLQHWTGPVLQEFSMPPLGAAEAKIAMEATVKKASLENILIGGD